MKQKTKLINYKALRKAVKYISRSDPVKLGEDFMKGLEIENYKLIKQAISRTYANKRKILMAKDI